MFSKIIQVLLFIFISFVYCDFDLSEGDPCELDNGRNGTCYHIHNCLASLIDLKNKKHPKICSFQGSDPVVCCADCEKVNDTRTIVIDTDNGVFFKNGQKARDYCLELASCLPYQCRTYGLVQFQDYTLGCNIYEQAFGSVVVGGEDAERFKYPHMALLGYGSSRESAQWLCGGSLISNKFILTAAHCISSPSVGPVTFAALGLLKRTDAPELWKLHRVRRIIPHPEYHSPSKYHDIALLEIDPVNEFSKAVFPACLDFDETSATYVHATGWGLIGKSKVLADNLQEIPCGIGREYTVPTGYFLTYRSGFLHSHSTSHTRSPVTETLDLTFRKDTVYLVMVSLSEFTEEECRQQYPEHRHLLQGYSHKTQQCYGDDSETKDTCEGDSGGPIQVSSPISKCMWTVVGVTSSGRACGYAPGNSGLYTRLSHYLPWIESIVWA